jgi:hypothetical protein
MVNPMASSSRLILSPSAMSARPRLLVMRLALVLLVRVPCSQHPGFDDDHGGAGQIAGCLADSAG